ncbi:MAG: class I SAM-dependent methyltransferase [Candidatus Omnitrophica bacterium]|nr:class I SAM-dependent methyltransferase [Candidatus Omnitrophota bacterium]
MGNVLAMKVLQDKLQISKARQELIKKGISFVDSPLKLLIRRLKLISSIAIGDMLKSWDVLSSLDFVERNVQKNESILDIGCYASELIVALHKLGYSNLTGVDLNVNLRKMPYQDFIRYEINDFMRTSFVDASFKAITSISVIEHGFDEELLLKEVSRLLKPSGYFIASFDYWPEKIDTKGIRLFGMDWNIFSKDEIVGFIAKAAGYGLLPAGDIMYSVKDKPIDCQEKQYTFAWLVLRKLA